MSIVCSICQDRLTDKPQCLSGDGELVLVALRCGHLLHKICAEQWFRHKPECPCCARRCRLDTAQRIYPTCDNYDYEEQSQKLEDAAKLTEDLSRSFSKKEAELREEVNAHENLKVEHAKLLSQVDTLMDTLRSLRLIIEKLDDEKEEGKKKIEELERKERMLLLKVLKYKRLWAEEKMKRKILEELPKPDKKKEITGGRQEDIEIDECEIVTENGNIAGTDTHDNTEQKTAEKETKANASDSGSDVDFEEDDTDPNVNLELGLEHVKRGIGMMMSNVLSYYRT